MASIFSKAALQNETPVSSVEVEPARTAGPNSEMTKQYIAHCSGPMLYSGACAGASCLCGTLQMLELIPPAFWPHIQGRVWAIPHTVHRPCKRCDLEPRISQQDQL